MRLALAALLTLVAAIPAAAQEPAYTTAINDEIDGGSVTRGDARTAYGHVNFGGVPGAYEIDETRNADGTWDGRFRLYLDRKPVVGRTHLVPASGGFTRTWTVGGTDYNCFSPAGSFTENGSWSGGGTFFSRLDGSFTCHGNGPGSAPVAPSNHRFRVKLHVTELAGDSVIGRMSSGRTSLMNTVDGGIVTLLCDGGRCSLELWDTRGALFGSLPVRIVRRGGRHVYLAGHGSTQIGGRGDPEYRTVRATAPWHLVGALDAHHRGTLTLTGGVFR